MYNNSYGSNGSNQCFMKHLCDFIGQTVTVFTESGGASGCGFTGILLAVNCDYIRIGSKQGTPPANPLAENICNFNNRSYNGNGSGSGCASFNTGNEAYRRDNDFGRLGSVCDIPISKIVSFCHNAV